MSLAKDQSLTVVVSGKTDAVLKARKMIVQNLQTQVINTGACRTLFTAYKSVACLLCTCTGFHQPFTSVSPVRAPGL